MYDDPWFSYLPDNNKKEDINFSSNEKLPGRKQSLLQQPDDVTFDADSISSSSVTLLEPAAFSNLLPVASLVKRPKSYGDFYEVLKSPLQDEAGSKTSRYSVEIPSITEPLNSTEEFEDELLKYNLEEYKLYLDNLELFERHLDKINVDTKSALTHLETLSKSFQSIKSETTAFQVQCEKLLTEEKKLVDLTDEVGIALQYYAYLESLTRRLNAVGAGRIVTSEDFLDMLLNLNSCIDFMDKHPSYRDSSTFKTRYLSLLDKSLNFVSRSFTSAFKDVTDEVNKELRSKDHNETSEYILLYGKFQPIQARLGNQIESLLKTTNFAFGRKGDKIDIAPYALRYHELWGQIADVYIKSRDSVTLVVTKNLKKFIATENPETDFQVFARHAVRYVLDICQNEQALMLRNFQGGPLLTKYETPPGWGKNSNYATRLEENVFIHLKTLHNHISPYFDNVNQQNICGLVEWLETMYLTSIDEESDIETSRRDRASVAYVYLSEFLWKSLDESFIKAAMEIEHYKLPQSEMNSNELSIQKATPGSNGEESQGRHNNINQYLISTAYPTVKTAINLLILYNDGFADRPRNSDVSYEIVHQTTKSLQMAATVIKRNSCIMDAQLFLIKNLMLIENIFMTNEIPDSVRQAAEFDFSPIWSTISELQDQRQLFNPFALISPLIRGKLLPTVVDRVLDAKKEMESVLIQQMNAFTKTWQVRLKEKDNNKRKIAEIELEELLSRVFEDQITRATIWKMIRAESLT